MPKTPLVVTYPAFTNLLFFVANADALRLTILPYLLYLSCDLVNPPLVFLAVPCITCALDPVV